MNELKLKYKQITISAIDNIKKHKESIKKHPKYALRVEILSLITKGVDKVLADMVKDGELKSGDTVNDLYFD